MSENKTNNKVDLIKGDPKLAIRTIAGPMIFMLILNTVYNMVDRIWVAGLGPDPLAALGFVTPLFIIMGGLANGFGAGANSLISRYIGAENKEKASNSGIHGIIIGIIISIIIPLILLIFLDPILIIMGAKDVMQYARPYAIIILIGSFTIVMNGILSSELRAEGDVKRSTLAIAFTGVINMIIDPIFIYTLNMGVIGAALATIISALIATLIMIYWMFIKKDTYIDVGRKYFNYNGTIMKQLISVSLPASVEQLIISLISIIMNAILVIVAGTEIVAGYTAAWSIIQLGMMPAVGIATAAITVSGVAYGQRNWDKLKTACYYSIKLGLLISTIIFIILELFAPQISLLFSYSASSANLNIIISNILRIIAVFLLGVPVGLSCASTFQGMGKGTISLILTILRELILVLLIAYILTFILGMGAMGVYLGLILGAIIGSIIAYIVFKEYLKRIIKLQGK